MASKPHVGEMLHGVRLLDGRWQGWVFDLTTVVYLTPRRTREEAFEDARYEHERLAHPQIPTEVWTP